MVFDYDLVIVGGGPAGLAGACSAREEGVEKILILERNEYLGGILNQCVHNGFGLHYFQKDLTGPEYAAEFISRIRNLGIDYQTGATVLSISPARQLTVSSCSDGIKQISAKSIILAMGCRERAAGSLPIGGTRPAGVITAGTAQRLMNLEGYHVGNKAVILGSGDIGLIMARRLVLEGKEVVAVVEQLPHSNGLPRNIAQCLDDFEIPVLFNHTVTEILGRERVEGIVVSRVTSDLKPAPGTRRRIECDTLILSVGLIPENELSKGAGVILDQATGGPLTDENLRTNIEGILACGNVLHVHDLVDNVSKEGEKAGRSAAIYINNKSLWKVGEERDERLA